MSVSQPLRCLLSKPAALSKPSRRALHGSSVLYARRRPRYNSIKADDMALMGKLNAGLVDVSELDATTQERLMKTTGSTWSDISESELQQINQAALEDWPGLTKTSGELLSKKYSKAQVDAIREAEAAIDQRDLVTQGMYRDDTARIKYTNDDFTEIDYVLDKKKKKTGWPLLEGQTIGPKTEKELYAKLAEFIVKTGDKYLPGDKLFNPADAPTELLDQLEVEWMKFIEDPRTLYNAPNEEVYQMMDDPARSAEAAELPKIKDKIVQQTVSISGSEEEDPGMQAVQLRMDWTLEEIRKIRTKTLVQRRVVNQTRMGKVASGYFLTIAGNRDGLLGIGEGKSTEFGQARQQSMLRAIRNMKPIQRYEDRTIYGEVKGKVGATELVMSAKHPGFGNRAMHLIFEMTRAAGIEDLHARVTRARNPMNVCKATMQALLSQKLPEDIARGRGRKLVDVRKVYYGGITPG